MITSGAKYCACGDAKDAKYFNKLNLISLITTINLIFLAQNLVIKINYSNFAKEVKIGYIHLKKVYYILFLVMALCVACQFKLKPNADEGELSRIEVLRYDRLEARYLTTGDFSALQQMNISYPEETRTLLEDVLNIGEVNDPEINTKFLNLYQDTVLQKIILDAESQYLNMDDIKKRLNKAFNKLEAIVPNLHMPKVYAQIGALDESIVIGDKSIGISLDKYLGEDYPVYLKFYSKEQRKSMVRDNIVPDCLTFYLLSLYPMKNPERRAQIDRDLRMGKMMWIANKLMGKNFFDTPYTKKVDDFVRQHPHVDMKALLELDDYSGMQ